MSTRKKIFLWIAAFLGVWLFFAVFILGLPWRWAFERRVAEFKARGEPVCAADLAPKPVPAEENGAPLLEAIWREIGASQAWKLSGALNSRELTFLEMQDLIQTESARIKAGQNSPAPEPQSPSSSHLSREEYDKLYARKNARQQVHDLSQLLRAQPDLVDRLEAALSKPHFHFSLEYKFPAMDIREPLGCSRYTANLLADLSTYFLAAGDREKARRCRLMLLRSPQILNSSYSFEGSKAHVAMTGSAVYHLNSLCSHLTVKELEELQQAAQNMKAWSTSWQPMLANHRVWFIEVIQASPKYSSSENGFIPGPIYFLLHTGFRYYDGLGTFNDFDDAMSDPEYTLKRDFHSYMGKGLESLGSYEKKWQLEAAKIRQLRLGLALELIKRKTSRYPADLNGLDLPKEDAEGKPMKYEVFGEGRGACLEFASKVNSTTVHFGLGELPEKHPLGEALK